jgi:hypothetical protein
MIVSATFLSPILPPGGSCSSLFGFRPGDGCTDHSASHTQDPAVLDPCSLRDNTLNPRLCC